MQRERSRGVALLCKVAIAGHHFTLKNPQNREVDRGMQPALHLGVTRLVVDNNNVL